MSYHGSLDVFCVKDLQDVIGFGGHREGRLRGGLVGDLDHVALEGRFGFGCSRLLLVFFILRGVDRRPLFGCLLAMIHTSFSAGCTQTRGRCSVVFGPLIGSGSLAGCLVEILSRDGL